MYCYALWTYIDTLENIIKELIGSLLLQPQQHFDRFQRLLASLADFEQRNVVQAALKLIPREYLSSIVVSDDSDWWRSDMEAVSATATLINAILCDQYSRKATVISWLTSASGAGVGEGIAVRRATIAALGTKKADVEVIFDKSLKQFGDPLYIRHTSVMQQEGMNVSLHCLSTTECRPSTHTGLTLGCWLCPPASTFAPCYDDEIRDVSERDFE